MAESISSWLAKAIVAHDEKHGANLEQRTDCLKRLVQIKKFHTFRTDDDPKRQITGLVSDRTHDVPVEFDVEATDRFESPDTDLPQETLTSNLRSILIVRSYRWKLEPPKRRRSADGHLELPIVKMVILDFDLHSGNKDSPIYFEDTCEIGKGKNDGPVQKVLRKWYFGESNSDPSQPDKSFDISQPEAGPSRLIQSSSVNATAAPPLPDGVILLSTFLAPFIAEDGAKRGRPIPEWIFKTSDETRAGLEQVQMFGLDFDTGDVGVATPAISSTGRATEPSQEQLSDHAKVDKSKQKEPTQSSPISAKRPDMSDPQTQYTTPPVPLGQRPRSTQSVTQPTLESPGADDEDSDGEIPIRPPIGFTATQRRPIFDPLAFSSQASEGGISTGRNAAEDEEDEEIEYVDGETTDSEMLSDYERSARRRRKQRVEGESEVKHEVKDEPMPQDEESIPASESFESYSLSKQFPSPGKRGRTDVDGADQAGPAHSSASRRREPASLPIVVGHASMQEPDSLGSNKTASGGTQSLPTPPPSDNQPDIGEEGNANLPSPAKQPKTEHRALRTPPAREEKRETARDLSAVRLTETETTGGQRLVGQEQTRYPQDYLKIDMTVSGLTEDTVQEYTRKVREKRAAAAQKRRESETPRHSDR